MADPPIKMERQPSMKGKMREMRGHGRWSDLLQSQNKHATRSPESRPRNIVTQMSYAEATEITTVTTTKRKIVKLDPMRVARSQRHLQPDPKRYPLYSIKTPDALRAITFDYGGQQMRLDEAEDPVGAMQAYNREQNELRRANGKVRTVEKHFEDANGEELHSAHPLHRSRSIHEQRPASPKSISDQDHDNEAEGSSRAAKRRKLSLNASRPTMQTHSRLREMQNNPVTPESEPRRAKGTRQPSRNPSHAIRSASGVLPTPRLEQSATFPGSQESFNSISNEEFTDVNIHTERSPGVSRGASLETTVPTPPTELDEGNAPSTGRALSSIPARLQVTESPSAQDGSLPSPSLSPVTAAAKLHHGDYFADAENVSGLDRHVNDGSTYVSHLYTPGGSVSDEAEMVEQPSPFASGAPEADSGSFSLTDIPAMIDFFEAMPDGLKGYVMHQLLRRCPKTVLQQVADGVNPALKCDFLTALPPELGLNVVRCLDLRSLCKAAQVSKKWREMINTDEKVWKELFDIDRFNLPEGEMQQAITEGWGWQDPHGRDGYEMDISTGNPVVKLEPDFNTPSPSASHDSLLPPLRRSKRKAASSLSTQHRQPKRKRSTRSSRETSLDITSVDWTEQVNTKDGPFRAAEAALTAVPHPDVGLPSLKGLHLYKSLYRRHYSIRRNWMHEETAPRHLAFRAHDTHVVTCLQFDADKILTGSDDNNINMYDTKSGMLLAKLTGHEGGVWALQYDGNILVSGSTDRSVRIWNLATREQKQVFRGHTSTVRCLQIVKPVKIGEMADGKPIMMPKQPLIITGSRDSTLRIWKLPGPDDRKYIQVESEADADDCPYFLRALTGHQHSVRAIAAHGDTLVSGSYDCTVRVWKISTGESVLTLRGHSQKVYSVVLDHARNRCISGSMDNMVRIWDLDTGAVRYQLEGHSSLVGLLDLQADKLVSAAADSTLRIWDPENGSCKATLTAHTGAITCFQHDGQKVISGSDRTLKLWNVKNGECVKDLLSELSGVWQVRFDERRCVAAVQREGVTFIEVCHRFRS